jgi:hypothetical protein
MSSVFSFTTFGGALAAFSAFFFATSRAFCRFFTIHSVRIEKISITQLNQLYLVHSVLDTISPVSSSLNSFAGPASVVAAAGVMVASATDCVRLETVSLTACAAFPICSAIILAICRFSERRSNWVFFSKCGCSRVQTLPVSNKVRQFLILSHTHGNRTEKVQASIGPQFYQIDRQQ